MLYYLLFVLWRCLFDWLFVAYSWLFALLRWCWVVLFLMGCWLGVVGLIVLYTFFDSFRCCLVLLF